MAHDDGPVRRANAACRLDVSHVLEHQRVATHQPCKRGHAEHGHGHDDVGHAAAQNRHHPQRQQDARKGKQHVRDAHHDAVPPAFVVPGQQAKGRADHAADHHRQEASGQRDACTHQDAAEDVAAQWIDAEPMHHRRAFIEPVVVEKAFSIVRNDVGRKHCDQHQQQHKGQRGHGHMLFFELAPELAPRRADGRRIRGGGHRCGSHLCGVGRRRNGGRCHDVWAWARKKGRANCVTCSEWWG